jgi:hypothetical protein
VIRDLSISAGHLANACFTACWIAVAQVRSELGLHAGPGDALGQGFRRHRPVECIVVLLT